MQHGVRTHVFLADLAWSPARRRVWLARIAARGLVVDALVNNAGYGVPGGLLDCEMEAARGAAAGCGGERGASSRIALLPGMIARATAA